jgi:mono/diheme cytochrome c family protein
MPPFDLSASELGACVEYAGRLRASAPASTEEAWRTICARCHGLDGKGRTAVAPHLARRPRDLSDTRFFREVGGPRLARAMADGVPGTPMAPWGRAVAGLSGPRIVTFLAKRLHGGGLPAVRDLEVPARPASLTPRAVSKARMVFDRECSQCHGPGGRGDGPESAGMRPQPRDLTAAVFVSAIDDARLYRSITYGPPGGPMPGHLRGYDPEVMWALVAKVRQLAADPDVRGYGDDVWPWQRHRAQGLAPGRPPAGIATPGAAPGAAGATREAE